MQKHPNTKDKAMRTIKNFRTKQSTKGANTKTKKGDRKHSWRLQSIDKLLFLVAH